MLHQDRDYVNPDFIPRRARDWCSERREIDLVLHVAAQERLLLLPNLLRDISAQFSVKRFVLRQTNKQKLNVTDRDLLFFPSRLVTPGLDDLRSQLGKNEEILSKNHTAA